MLINNYLSINNNSFHLATVCCIDQIGYNIAYRSRKDRAECRIQKIHKNHIRFFSATQRADLICDPHGLRRFNRRHPQHLPCGENRSIMVFVLMHNCSEFHLIKQVVAIIPRRLITAKADLSATLHIFLRRRKLTADDSDAARAKRHTHAPFRKKSSFRIICLCNVRCVQFRRQIAKLIQQLQRVSEVPFEAKYLVMDPGYHPVNRTKIQENAALLGIPIQIFDTDIFAVTESEPKNCCYLCARMRRGHLYSLAQSLGCNKIALGHHFDDVIETTLMGMLYGGQIQGMMPKLHSTNFPGMELIRPLYCVKEKDIIAWKRYNDLEFIQCACRMTEKMSQSLDGIGTSKRQAVKQLIATLAEENSQVPKNIFKAIHAVSLDTMVGYKSAGVEHTFLEWYDTLGSALGKPEEEG